MFNNGWEDYIVYDKFWGIAQDRLIHNLRYSRFSYQALRELKKSLSKEIRFFRGDAAYLDSLDDILQEIEQEIYVRDSWAIVFSR